MKTNGTLTIDNAHKIDACLNSIDESIENSETLANLTHEQKIELSNIVSSKLLANFDCVKINFYGEYDE